LKFRINFLRIKFIIFWHVTPCRSCENLRLGGMLRHHLRLLPNCYTAPLSRILATLKMENISLERRISQDIHGATSQRTVLSIATAVETSHLT
jgi:hypothetical protein